MSVGIKSENTLTIISLVSRLILAFILVVLSRNSFSKKPFKSPWLRLYILALIKLNHSEKNEKVKAKLKFCTKVVFYSSYTLSLISEIEHTDLQKDLFFSILINLKGLTHSNFYQSLLVLSGDISLNPGPVQNKDV